MEFIKKHKWCLIILAVSLFLLIRSYDNLQDAIFLNKFTTLILRQNTLELKDMLDKISD